MLRDIQRSDPQITAILAVIVAHRPDVLILTDIDYDYDWFALTALQSALMNADHELPHAYTQTVNAGLATPYDFDGDGRFGEPEDAQGWGRFHGNGGLAVLSRWPIDTNNVVDYTETLWRDLPHTELPEFEGNSDLIDHQRLSSTGHWIVPVQVDGKTIDLMIYAATPPVFDGPEDRNGLRNRDELRLWEQVIAKPRENPFVIVGNTNLDPFDGDGITDAMQAFLAMPAITDPEPRSAGGALSADPDQSGDPSLDTADWPDNKPGNLRVSYILPSADQQIMGAGVFWPAPDDPLYHLLGDDGLAAGPHRLVWVDIAR